MMNFKELDLPKFYKLLPEFNYLSAIGKIGWDNKNQICLNTTEDEPDNFKLGAGSLYYDWSKAKVTSLNGINKIIVPEKNTFLKESDFTVLCSQFRGTEFELLYKFLQTKFNIGRVRLMRSESKTCLSWHSDNTPRIHYPLKTQKGCYMVIENEVQHLPEHTWWWTNTVNQHTAFNASKETRIHVVACLL